MEELHLRRVLPRLRALRLRRPVRPTPYTLLHRLLILTLPFARPPGALWLTHPLLRCGSSPHGSACGASRPGCGGPRCAPPPPTRVASLAQLPRFVTPLRPFAQA